MASKEGTGKKKSGAKRGSGAGGGRGRGGSGKPASIDSPAKMKDHGSGRSAQGRGRKSARSAAGYTKRKPSPSLKTASTPGNPGTRPSLSVVVPCYNEATNVRGTVESIKAALKEADRFSGYEVLIFNDCSTDETGRIADEIAEKEPEVRVIHNPANRGFGYNYTEGVRQARNDYVIMVPGDNEIPTDAITAVLTRAGDADLIIPYTRNTWVRPLSRRVVSRAFVALINTLFGLDLRYYNGTCLIRSELLKMVPMTTWGFAYMAAILVRLIRSGATFVEVGVDIQQRETGESKAFRPSNVASVVSAILKLFWEVRVTERARYGSPARRAAATTPIER